MTIFKHSISIVALCVLWWIADAQTALGQDTASSEVKTLLQKVETAYAQASFLSFDVKYSYANITEPNQPNDSVTGKIQVDKNRCHLLLEGIETLITPTHTIQVIPDEQLIYIGASNAKSNSMDPKSMVDTLFHYLKGSITLLQSANEQTISIIFPPGAPYIKLSMTIDSRTGFLEKVRYDLRTEALVDKSLIRDASHPGPYDNEGTVLVEYSHYHQNAFGDEAFNEGNILVKNGNVYQPTGKYSHYQVFLANPNMQ
jgi:hypothetical protein